MKTLKYSIIAMVALLATACTQDDVENRPVVEGVTAPVLTAPEEGNTYVLSPETPDVLAERFVWTAADFGEGIIPTYEVQIDYAGENFDTPVAVGATNGTLQFAASHNVLNTALLSLGATPFVGGNFDVRIKASVATEVMYSESVEIIVTPYTTETPRLWVVGGYQSTSGYGENWAHATAPQLLAREYGDTQFEGYVYIANDQDATADTENGLKFSTVDNMNGTNYGAGSAAGTISADGGAANIAPNAGYYKVNVNTAEASLTYTLTATSWGLIGSSTAGVTGGDGWVSDADMTYDAATKKWSITLALVPGEIKFRANDAWTLNYGDDGADASLNEGGANIAVATAGTYKITLDLSSPRAYTYTVEQQ